MITYSRLLPSVFSLLLLNGCVGVAPSHYGGYASYPSYPRYAQPIPAPAPAPYYPPRVVVPMPYNGYNYNPYPVMPQPYYGGGRESRGYGEYREHENNRRYENEGREHQRRQYDHQER